MSELNPPCALRAKWIFPVIGPPIDGGIITIRGDRIAAVGENLSSAPPIDLGNVAIVPGLVNAHTHLEFSDLEAPLGEPGESLPTWIRRVIDYRRHTASNPASVIECGLHESILCGVTTLGEIDTSGWNASTITQQDVVLFRELLGLAPDRIDPLMATADAHLAAAWNRDFITPGLSPHAPYTVHPGLLAKVVALAVNRHIPLAMHLAESPEELELLQTGQGPFRELLESLGAWHNVIPRGTRPLDYLKVLVTAPRSLVIHGNYLVDEEVDFLVEHRDRLSVVYCPRTHAYFGHADYPLAKMLEAGVAICLGTDSRASNPDLSILDEMKFVAGHHPLVPLNEIVRFGTLNGAGILSGGDEFGALNANRRADLAVISLPERNTDDPHELLFTDESRVVQTWCRGKRI